MSAFLLMATLLSEQPPVRVLTSDDGGHILANRNCWSPDGDWLAYDTRTDEAVFDATSIRRVHTRTGEVQVLHESADPVGVPTYGPDGRIVFLAAPEDADEDWPYAAWHRHGLLLDPDGTVSNLDAQDFAAPYFHGALRGGTHLHTVGPCGRVASTYEDHVLATSEDPAAAKNLRTVAVTDLGRPVRVSTDHPRNRDGHHTVVAARVTDDPRPGTDDIGRAFSDAWLPDGRLAFLGRLRTAEGQEFDEIFVADFIPGVYPPDVGTKTTRPQPPVTVHQTRLTHIGNEWSASRGVGGPRFWPVSNRDGTLIAFYKKGLLGSSRLCVVVADEAYPKAGDWGVGSWRYVTSGDFPPQSAFTWSPAAPLIALVADGSVFVVNADTGEETRLTEKADPGPRHHACVFSPDGSRIAYMQPVTTDAGTFDQIAVVDLPAALTEGTE